MDEGGAYCIAVHHHNYRSGTALRHRPIARWTTATVTGGAIRQILQTLLAGRILPSDSAAAREFADIAATRRRAGQPIGEADARIAAIARSRGAIIATHNVDDFAGCGLAVIDPWV